MHLYKWKTEKRRRKCDARDVGKVKNMIRGRLKSQRARMRKIGKKLLEVYHYYCQQQICVHTQIIQVFWLLKRSHTYISTHAYVKKALLINCLISVPGFLVSEDPDSLWNYRKILQRATEMSQDFRMRNSELLPQAGL